MNKIFTKALLLFFLISSNVNSEIIKDIKISGNKRISNETVLVLGDIKLNDNFTSDKLNQTLKKLYDTNFFKNVSLSIDNSLLTIDLDENPIIENIEISGIKNKKVLEQIEKEISLKDRMSFSENLLNKDLELIKNFHKTNGFYFVKVKPSINRNDELNSVRIKLDIEQGDKAKIKEILFIGDKKFKAKLSSLHAHRQRL